MTNRYEEAITCQDAVNPSGVARVFTEQCAAFMRSPDYTGTDSVKRDPALRLIAYKLADLMGLHGMDVDDCLARMHAEEECRRMATRQESWADVMKRHIEDKSAVYPKQPDEPDPDCYDNDGNLVV